MKEGRAIILILRSIKKKGLQESTDERIAKLLLNTEKGEPREKLAEKLIKIIEDEKNTEADIIAILKQMEDRNSR